MKILFVILISLHALIHLMGFAKGFGWYDPKSLHLHINRLWGSIWLLSTLGLLAYAFAFLFLERHISIKIGVAALILSQLVLFVFWPDAKYGSLVNLVLLIVLLFSIAGAQFDQMVAKEKQQLLSDILHPSPKTLHSQDILHLPAPVQKWLHNSGSIGRAIPDYVIFKQSMRMKVKPDQENWYTATAEQLSTLRPPAFNWQVEMDIFPPLKMTGRDKFVAGKGEMLIKLNSLFTVVDADGKKIDEGALQRYLGEIAWVPGFALSPYIEWELIDDHSARATLSYQGTSGSGTFHFDNQGRFKKFVAMRYKDNDSEAERYKWIMSAQTYDTFAGISIPSSLNATWVLDKGEWTWLEMKVDELEIY